MVGGANIIRGMLEETYEDILESIENLRALRFFFKHGLFKHTMTNLGIIHSSRYYEQMKDDQANYRYSALVSWLPKNYIRAEEFYDCTIVEKMQYRDKDTWANFNSVEEYYIKSTYEYQILKKQTSILYKEKLNRDIINELEIDYTSLEYLILVNANDEVLSFEGLHNLIDKSPHRDIADCELFNTLEDLKKEGLIYSPSDYSEIVSIINLKNTI